MLKKGDKVQVVEHDELNGSILEGIQGKTYICSSDEFEVKGSHWIYVCGRRSPISVGFLVKEANE
ncbi:hypothetical protein bcere0016_4790 [Bacillus cereus 95/8201]|uniref:hypothetical protein n=1 Tax=Bacillus cereus group TaxID=86661 RepID=UPI0001A09602|nr:hypothetical protein [Bacillus cereus]EEL18793.1 hypothetical protein bcere0016_4790 [Bacillus cereus 95/8201]KWU67769.1 hypothetical protein AWW71_05960 [Bacillus cereus]MDQ4440199.1 hypothetical protein [Bacillus cereus]